MTPFARITGVVADVIHSRINSIPEIRGHIVAGCRSASVCSDNNSTHCRHALITIALESIVPNEAGGATRPQSLVVLNTNINQSSSSPNVILFPLNAAVADASFSFNARFAAQDPCRASPPTVPPRLSSLLLL